MNPAEFANIAQSEQTFWWYRGMNLVLFRLLDRVARQRSFERVLEAGCGTGYLAKLLGQRYGWRIFPVDLGWKGLEFARSLAVERLAQANIAQLPFADGSFDSVLSMDVIVHFPRGTEGGAMRELARVLAPGGLMVMRVSALDLLRSRHSEFAHEQQRFTRTRLMALAAECGIEVERCTYVNSILMAAALAKFRLWEPLTRAAPASGVTPVHPLLDRVLFSALQVEAAWLGSGRSFPIGQSLILIGTRR